MAILWRLVEIQLKKRKMSHSSLSGERIRSHQQEKRSGGCDADGGRVIGRLRLSREQISALQ